MLGAPLLLFFLFRICMNIVRLQAWESRRYVEMLVCEAGIPVAVHSQWPFEQSQFALRGHSACSFPRSAHYSESFDSFMEDTICQGLLATTS